MVVDSSAVLAILLGEPDADRYADTLSRPERRFMSAVSRLEAAIVAEVRKGAIGARAFSRLMAVCDMEVIAFDSGLSEIALDAWRRFGKGRHTAGLNLGDCVSYALAKLLDEPLLFKGEDFRSTDVAAVL